MSETGPAPLAIPAHQMLHTLDRTGLQEYACAPDTGPQPDKIKTLASIALKISDAPSLLPKPFLIQAGQQAGRTQEYARKEFCDLWARAVGATILPGQLTTEVAFGSAAEILVPWRPLESKVASILLWGLGVYAPAITAAIKAKHPHYINIINLQFVKNIQYDPWRQRHLQTFLLPQLRSVDILIPSQTELQPVMIDRVLEALFGHTAIREVILGASVSQQAVIIQVLCKRHLDRSFPGRKFATNPVLSINRLWKFCASTDPLQVAEEEGVTPNSLNHNLRYLLAYLREMPAADLRAVQQFVEGETTEPLLGLSPSVTDSILEKRNWPTLSFRQADGSRRMGKKDSETETEPDQEIKAAATPSRLPPPHPEIASIQRLHTALAEIAIVFSFDRTETRSLLQYIRSGIGRDEALEVDDEVLLVMHRLAPKAQSFIEAASDRLISAHQEIATRFFGIKDELAPSLEQLYPEVSAQLGVELDIRDCLAQFCEAWLAYLEQTS